MFYYFIRFYQLVNGTMTNKTFNDYFGPKVGSQWNSTLAEGFTKCSNYFYNRQYNKRNSFLKKLSLYLLILKMLGLDIYKLRIKPNYVYQSRSCSRNRATPTIWL